LWDFGTRQCFERLYGNPSEVWAVAFSPDDQRIVSGGWDQIARVWKVADGRELAKFEGHSDAVFAVAFSPDGERIVSGSLDRTARVWESANGHELFTLQGHSSSVVSVTFSADGQRIATAGDDQTARVWDVIGRHEVLAVKKHGSPISSVAFSPDGQRIITGGGSLVFSPDGIEQIHPGRGDGTVKVWELSDDREVLTLKGHTSRVFPAFLTAIIVTGSRMDGEIWEVVGKELKSLEVIVVGFGPWPTPDGLGIVTGSWDRRPWWNATNGQPLVTFSQHSNLITPQPLLPMAGTVTGTQDGTAKVGIRPWQGTVHSQRTEFPDLVGSAGWPADSDRRRGGVHSVITSRKPLRV
jgi:WD40 repeat protein